MTALQKLDQPQPARLTVEDFLVLDGSGAFDNYAKTELVDGEILFVNAQYSEHFTVKTILLRRLADACDALATGIEAWSEGGIAIPPNNVPEPDIFVTSERPVKGLVRVQTVRLVVEVSVTTVDFDRRKKARIYASGGIPEYWIVDVNARSIIQMWTPKSASYSITEKAEFGDEIRARSISGLKINTDGI